MSVRKTLIAFLGLLLTALVDGSFLANASAHLYFSCTLVGLTLFLFFRPSLFFIAVLVASFVLEQYSALPFGMVFVSLALASSVSWWFARHIVTNRTPIALATLMVTLTASFHLLDAAGRWTGHLLAATEIPLWLPVLVPWQVLGNVLAALAFAFLLGAFRTTYDPRIAPGYGIR